MAVDAVDRGTDSLGAELGSWRRRARAARTRGRHVVRQAHLGPAGRRARRGARVCRRSHAFAEQFRVDVSVIDAHCRDDLVRSTGEQQFAVVQMVWISDVAPAVQAALDALFGPSAWVGPRRYPVSDTWVAIDTFMRTVARLRALDPTTTELVRLRGARQHDCRLCSSRRSADAIDDGAGDAEFAAVDDYETSDLPEATKAALALVDAMIWTPLAIPATVVDDVRRLLTPRTGAGGRPRRGPQRRQQDRRGAPRGRPRGDRGCPAVPHRLRRRADHDLRASSRTIGIVEAT